MIALPVNVVSTQRELALALNVDERTVRRYIARGMPGQEGSYDIAACRDWIANNIRRFVIDDTGSLGEQKLRAETAKLWEQARREHVKNELIEGNLINRDDVFQWGAGILTRVRVRLEAAPDEFESRLPLEVRAQVKADLEDYMRLLCKEIADSVAAGPIVD